MVSEKLLHFIWRTKLFDHRELATIDGERIEIIQHGTYNLNAGPDFLNVKMKIGETVWAGNAELHICTSDWNLHNHSNDANYANTVLHIVWQHDAPKQMPNIPTLELNSRVSKLLLNRYAQMMEQEQAFPCFAQIAKIPEIVYENWLERMAVERMLTKANVVEKSLAKNNQHWEQTLWQLVARSFGLKVNADAFEAMANTIPVTILAKIKHNHLQIEAMLMGQAGLLEKEFEDSYPKMLQREYRYLKQKFSLQPTHHSVQFLKMRPAAFPTIRLSQLAAFVGGSSHLFSKINEATSLKDIYDLFEASANDYWLTHFVFDVESPKQEKKIGRTMATNIIINAIVPLLFAYAHHNKNVSKKEKYLQWLTQVLPEKNSITKAFEQAGCPNKNALQSQAMLHLHRNFCTQKRCLECAIGAAVLKNNED